MPSSRWRYRASATSWRAARSRCKAKRSVCSPTRKCAPPTWATVLKRGRAPVSGGRSDLEAVRLFRGALNRDFAHARRRRAAPRPIDQRFDVAFGPDEERLDRSIAPIADPAAQVPAPGFVRQRIAKADALHAAPDNDP